MKRRSSARALFAAGALALALLAHSATSFAQSDEEKKKEALRIYEQAASQYVVEEWGEAVRLFKKAYATYPAPAFLFNIAMSYYKGDDCKNALRFYDKYLALMAQENKQVKPEQKAEIEGYRNECIARGTSAAGSDTGTGETDTGSGSDAGTGSETDSGSGTEDGSDPGTGSDTGTDAGTVGDGGTQTGGSIGGSIGELPHDASAEAPSIVVARLLAGPAFHGFGDLETGTLFALALGAGYPLAVGPVVLDLGAFFSYTRVPWCANCAMDNDPLRVEDNATFATVLANVGASYPVIPRLAVRGEVGAGVALFGGLGDPANPFLEEDSRASGALSMPHIRAAAGAQYAVTGNIVLHLQAAYGYSPAKEGLREDISSLTALQLLLGAGYQM